MSAPFGGKNALSRRERRAAKAAKSAPGTAGCCPSCKSPRVQVMANDVPRLDFYGRSIAICVTCRTAWEPIPGELIWDPTDPCASLSEPCDNCAFRPGSPEQKDTAKWKDMIHQLRAGGAFFCHKGVPLDPAGQDGFAYPKDKSKLRLCRGYLNALGKWWGADEPTSDQPPGVSGHAGEPS